MPASIETLCDVTGQSDQTIRKKLQQLINLDLVVKTTFEKHSLYCLNGHYRHLINDIISLSIQQHEAS